MRKIILVGIILFLCVNVVSAATLHVAAAISLKDALTQVIKVYESKTGNKVELTLGSSGQLLEQIKAGAPMDIFISAASKQMDELASGKLLVEGTRQVIAGNEMVLIQNPKVSTRIDSFEQLPQVAHIAIGEPKTVPAGQYAAQIFVYYKMDKKLTDKIVYGTNVRQVLDYVIRGEVDAGIVYASDALAAGDKVTVVARADGKTHDTIEYTAAVIGASVQKELASAFLIYLQTPEAQKVLAKNGFTPLLPTTKPSK